MIEAKLGEIVFVNVTATDNNSFVFNVLNKPPGASFSSTGGLLNFTWNVTSSERVKIYFTVNPTSSFQCQFLNCFAVIFDLLRFLKGNTFSTLYPRRWRISKHSASIFHRWSSTSLFFSLMVISVRVWLNRFASVFVYFEKLFFQDSYDLE